MLDAVCCDATNKQFRLSACAATSCEDRSIALSEPSVRAGSSHRVVGGIKNIDTRLGVYIFYGADYGARTRHLRLGKATLYQMS